VPVNAHDEDDDDARQVLRFEDNRLTVLGDGEFSSYANLQEIYLARNRIELIEATAFRGLYSLQILDLEANQLTAVPAKSLRAVASSLRLLNLKNNPIRRLEADSLSSLSRLEEASFLFCQLFSLMIIATLYHDSSIPRTRTVSSTFYSLNEAFVQNKPVVCSWLYPFRTRSSADADNALDANEAVPNK